MSDPLALILLAAGSSSRMGHPKQLLEIDGESLIRRAVKLAQRTSCQPLIVVLGAYRDQIEPEIADLACVPVINENWTEGMGSSLVRGLQYLLENSQQPRGVLLMLVDMVGVQPDELQKMIELFEQNEASIIAANYQNTLGVPAIFPAGLFEELLKLKGDEGARKILKANQDLVVSIPLTDAGMDLDTPEDFRKIQSKTWGN